MFLLPLLLSISAHAGNAPKGGLDQKAISKTIAGEMHKVKDCYENNAGEQKPAGRVDARFTIDARGKVVEASILSSELKSLPVEACLTQALKGMTFAAPAGGGTVQVDYPFVFSPEKTAAKKKKK